ncbi:MAG TPA: hypothetical protein VKT82_04270 [Ktedonobacterales bacterium]|nr:hypothetical protein [Ktedonobacterales bacterium]
MQERLSKQELISLVQKIVKAEGSEQEIDAWLSRIDRSVPCPDGYVCDLIFYPHLHELGDGSSAEEIVEKALRYKPIQL